MSDVLWPWPSPLSTCGANAARRFTAQRVDGGLPGAIIVSNSKTALARSGKRASAREVGSPRDTVKDAASSLGLMTLDRASDVLGHFPDACARRSSTSVAS